MNCFVLAYDSSCKFRFEILKFICIRFCDLCFRDACPLRKNYCNVINGEGSCKSVRIRLNLVLKKRESLIKLFFFLFKCLCSFEILCIYGSLLLILDLCDLLLEIVLDLGICIVDTLSGSCLIDKVDGLIRQESV